MPSLLEETIFIQHFYIPSSCTTLPKNSKNINKYKSRHSTPEKHDKVISRYGYCHIISCDRTESCFNVPEIDAESLEQLNMIQTQISYANNVLVTI